MKRRELLVGLGAAAATWPVVARAQQPAMPVVGFLSPRSVAEAAHLAAAFRQGLSESGYVEGRNIAIEYRWADGQPDRLPALAADLVRRRVAVIAATSGPAPALAAKAATTTIPIVFNMGSDPVALGLVASLNRPAGNLTGVSSLNVELEPKRLELLHELVPMATIVALLVNPTRPGPGGETSELRAAARTLGVQLQVLQASTDRDFDAVFVTLLERRAGALLIGTDSYFINRSAQLGALTVRHAVPAIHQFRDFTSAGGLMSYGGSQTDEFRQVGVYTSRILKVEKPAELPVQQTVKVELAINVKTAKALGLTVPNSLLGRADEVIE